MQTCETCKYFEDYINDAYPYGTCVHPLILDVIRVGYCDDWDFHKDFGCILHELEPVEQT